MPAGWRVILLWRRTAVWLRLRTASTTGSVAFWETIVAIRDPTPAKKGSFLLPQPDHSDDQWTVSSFTFSALILPPLSPQKGHTTRHTVQEKQNAHIPTPVCRAGQGRALLTSQTPRAGRNHRPRHLVKPFNSLNIHDFLPTGHLPSPSSQEGYVYCHFMLLSYTSDSFFGWVFFVCVVLFGGAVLCFNFVRPGFRASGSCVRLVFTGLVLGCFFFIRKRNGYCLLKGKKSLLSGAGKGRPLASWLRTNVCAGGIFSSVQIWS